MISELGIFNYETQRFELDVSDDINDDDDVSESKVDFLDVNIIINYYRNQSISLNANKNKIF